MRAARSKALAPNWPTFAPPQWPNFTPPLTEQEGRIPYQGAESGVSEAEYAFLRDPI
jgi:hypothetical protein